MGSLTLPYGAVVYVDSSVLIYTVQRHVEFLPQLRPFWYAVRKGALRAVSSELTIMECLDAPLRDDVADVLEAFEGVFSGDDISFRPVSRNVLRGAARLRAANPTLKTPDAIHLATAQETSALTVLTNDKGLRSVPQTSVTVLADTTIVPPVAEQG